MKYSYKISTIFKTLLIIFSMLSMCSVVYTIVRIITLLSITDLPHIIALVFTALICTLFSVVAMCGVTARYCFCNGYLALKVGTVDVLSKRVKYTNIVNVAYVKDTDKLYISYMWKNLDPVIMQINIDHNEYESFINQLTSTNENIVNNGDTL